MTTPEQNTKIARLIEAHESLISATDKHATTQDLLDARKELHEALAEFLLPVLRVHDGKPQMGGPVQVTCITCEQAHPCNVSCEFWAKSIRLSVHEEIHEDTHEETDDDGDGLDIEEGRDEPADKPA